MKVIRGILAAELKLYLAVQLYRITKTPLLNRLVMGAILSINLNHWWTRKDNITVLITASTSGQKFSRMIVFNLKYLRDNRMAPEDQCFPYLAYTCYQKGRMEWMEICFICYNH